MAAKDTTPKRILVFGATGLIGQHIIQQIYNARDSFDKIGFFTSASTAKSKADELEEWRKRGVDVIVGNIDSEEDVVKAYESTSPSCTMHRTRKND